MWLQLAWAKLMGTSSLEVFTSTANNFPLYAVPLLFVILFLCGLHEQVGLHSADAKGKLALTLGCTGKLL